jgi:uncharacterized paraquat-inducible protein A
MAFQRSGEGSDPVRGERIGHTEHRIAHSTVLAAGTFACPECDAPVSPGARPLRPKERVACPYCGHAGAVRDFLSLAAPTRPAYVEVHVRGLSTRG